MPACRNSKRRFRNNSTSSDTTTTTWNSPSLGIRPSCSTTRSIIWSATLFRAHCSPASSFSFFHARHQVAAAGYPDDPRHTHRLDTGLLSASHLDQHHLVVGTGSGHRHDGRQLDHRRGQYHGTLAARGDAQKAVLRGTQEVVAPMLSSILTTCAVFVPLIFINGMAGALFYDQAMAVAITLFVAYGTTITLLPVYYRWWYRNQPTFRPTPWLDRFSFDRITKRYERILVWFFRHRALMWGHLRRLPSQD